MSRRLAACLATAACLGAAAWHGGCAVNLLRVAPPVDFTGATRADSAGFDPARLRRGRAIYLDQCSRCHPPFPIADNGKWRWEAVVPRMIERAKLDSVAAADVSAYIDYALTSAPPR